MRRPLTLQSILNVLAMAAAVGLIACPSLAQTPEPASQPVATNTATTTVPAAVPGDSNQDPSDSLDDSEIQFKDGQRHANKIKSVFFTREEMQDIRLAVNTYRKHFAGKNKDAEFNEEDFISQLTGMRKSKKTSRYFMYPQFYLQSVVYDSPKSWVVWINDSTRNQKINQDTPQDDTEIHVLSINENTVKFEWRPVAMEKVLEVWEKSPNEEVIVDKFRGTVRFTLRPNQTFSSFVMRPLEGKVVPVTIDNNIGEAVIAAPAPVRTPEAADAAAPKKEGLSGLIGAYSNIGKEAPKPQSEDSPPPIITTMPMPPPPKAEPVQ
jgi:hypothetical protein